MFYFLPYFCRQSNSIWSVVTNVSEKLLGMCCQAVRNIKPLYVVITILMCVSLMMIQVFEDVTSCRLANGYRRLRKIVMPCVEVKLSNCFSLTLNMIWHDIPEDLNLFCQHRCENLKCLFYCVELFVFSFRSEKWRLSKLKVKLFGFRLHLTCRKAGKLQFLYFDWPILYGTACLYPNAWVLCGLRLKR